LAWPITWSGVVELLGLDKWVMSPGVNHESRLGGHGDDLADRLLQCAQGIGIGRLVEADMACRKSAGS